MIRKTLAAAGILLVVFHGWLLAGQAWGGQLADLALIARWLVAAGLIVGLRRLQQQGASIFFSRRAVALWLLAALLHGPALAQRIGVDAPAVPEIVATLAQVSTTGTAIAASLLLLLMLVLRRGRRASRPIARVTDFEFVTFGAASSPSHSVFAPRPPPII